MVNFKQEIAKEISKITKIPEEQIVEYIEIPTDEKMGDFSFPCFKLAKELRKAPQMIAQEIKENIKFENELMQNIEVVNGYLNFYVMPEKYVLNVLNEIADKQEEYGKSTIGNGKNVVVDYSAPNIAKPFHIVLFPYSSCLSAISFKTFKTYFSGIT
jgi:arginyl-tRNA synthetase